LLVTSIHVESSFPLQSKPQALKRRTLGTLTARLNRMRKNP
jgi:hypothetical protein